jgi:hypothetical protein
MNMDMDKDMVRDMDTGKDKDTDTDWDMDMDIRIQQFSTTKNSLLFLASQCSVQILKTICIFVWCIKYERK